MNILALNTLTMHVALAASGSNGMFSLGFYGRGHQAAEQLVPLTDTLLTLAGLTADTVERVYALQGPGSFTGLRLGYALAKALQLSTQSLFIPVPPLDCIAAMYAEWEQPIITVIDARRNRFYARVFFHDKKPTEIFDKTAEELLTYIPSSQTCLVAGFGVNSFRANISAVAKKRCTFIETSPEALARNMHSYAEAASLVNADVPTEDYAAPIYVRKSDAEENE